ncbi:DUF5986 family protein [Rossellomorea vietnamensis]|uniref:DUF5986 family protein n=1 Tax=Rossellomorea vietnamensis TaxID=218284 RepID=UPI003CF6ECDA
MSEKKYEVPLHKIGKLAIIESIANAIDKDLIDFKSENKLVTYNSIHMLKWDFTNTNLVNKFENTEFTCYVAKRGAWRFILLYDKINKILYTLMRRERFEQIQSNEKTDKVHYIESLVSPNKELSVPDQLKRSFQGDLFDMNGEGREEKLQEVFNDLTQNLGPIEKYVLITFESDKNMLTSVSALLLTSKLEIAYEEDWSDLIPASYDSDEGANESQETYEDGFEEIELPIRDKSVPKEDEAEPFIRKNDGEKKGEDS